MCLNKEKNFVSAVVYICNHEHEITSFLKMLNACFKENFEKYEIICVDDGSSDNSIAAIRAHAAEYGFNCTYELLSGFGIGDECRC